MANKVTASQIDRLARGWNDLDARQEALDAERDALRSEILESVEIAGELAERSSKTQSLPGREFELRVTQSSETRVDQKAAREFLEACPRAIGEQVFRREEKLVLVESPDRVPGGADLGVAIRRLFQQAIIVKARSPRIEARPLVPETKEKAKHA